jgi:hypothetical protein
VPRFDWAGTEQVAQRNLLRFTEEFDNAAWTKVSGALVTQDTETAPNGTVTADTFNGAGYLQQSVTSTGVQTFSVYAKAGVGASFVLGGTGIGTLATFDLSAQTATVGTGISAAITDQGSGWFRCVVSFDFVVSSVRIIGTSIGNTIYIWGAQLELGDTATAYQTIGAQIPTNTPLRPTATCNGLLIEEARTNRLLWCRDATQTNWTKTDITAAKDATGIDGVANAASSLSATVNGGTCIQTITLASGSRTGSVYLKRLTGTGAVQVSLDGSTWSTVELSDTEWRRIVLSGTVTNPVVGVRIAVSGDAVAMDFGQVEDGAFVTSPILTTGATATRSGELPSMSEEIINGFFNSGEGTIAANFLTFAAGTNRRIAQFNLTTGTELNYVHLAIDTTNRLIMQTRISGGAVSSSGVFPPISIQSGEFNNSAGLFSFSSLAVSNNGGGVNESANNLGSTPPIRVLFVGSGPVAGSSSINGYIKRLTYYPKRNQGSVLQAITGPAT